ncbi:glycosyltransferase family 39 protein [Bifidobacterium mongoliense]|uniref:Glycosyl transferase family 39 n=1 Tax=Bifidobacterium mongoliense DSM 21395 TaxID=1437603 RepID=A0A087C7M9_9BIFI|nr:glycosyltransferase family 39 protein [Bifidobacterium mongoliense]KFI79279.1 glycosyl transferase family 39 [Bifidobacterium mongoliense DSM 21395]
MTRTRPVPAEAAVTTASIMPAATTIARARLHRVSRRVPDDASDLLLYRMPRRTLRDRLFLILLLAASAVVFLVNLTVSGYANEFYSAAAQAGSMDWTAFLFGSLDPGNAITVDKPPASIWIMALSVRLLGLSSLSILLPQALMGIATTCLVSAINRRPPR